MEVTLFWKNVVKVRAFTNCQPEIYSSTMYENVSSGGDLRTRTVRKATSIV
jgi:hypothetical protein